MDTSAATSRLSPEFSAHLESYLRSEKPSALAAQVMKLSDFYNSHPGFPTPWDEKFAGPAYLSYFLPLNYARFRSAFREVLRFLPEVNEIWDFGAGIGTAQWVLESDYAPRPLHVVESAAPAVKLYRDLLAAWSPRWKPQFAAKVAPAAGALGIFSYSFLEMQNMLPPLEKFDHLLIVEPSTRECGRSLMEWRSRFLQDGWSVLAPCTHAETCPLLVHSQRDWCHMRVAFEAPEWWMEIESHLPMKNRTLTYSYLLLSRTVRDERWRGAARVIGDTLPEKGKTRQMICRGPEREFFAWLHKNGEPPRIPHGSLARWTEAVAKSNELRVSAVEWEI